MREVLGEGVQQKGSLVDPDKLRFDFSHNKAMSDEELARVESLVNERIARKWSVNAETAPQEDALKINGLRAVFGEKYPHPARIGRAAPVIKLHRDQPPYPFGGTNVSRVDAACPGAPTRGISINAQHLLNRPSCTPTRLSLVLRNLGDF